jgi:hypothetical protein
MAKSGSVPISLDNGRNEHGPADPHRQARAEGTHMGRLIGIARREQNAPQ